MPPCTPSRSNQKWPQRACRRPAHWPRRIASALVPNPVLFMVIGSCRNACSCHELRVQGCHELPVRGRLPVLRLRAQTITHLTSKHLFHPSERRSRARRLHAVTSGSRARKAPRRWSPTPRGLPRLHGRLVVRAVSLRLTRTTHTARTRKTPASPSATGSPSTSSRASRIAIKFTLPQPHLRHLHDGSTFRRDPRHRIRTW